MRFTGYLKTGIGCISAFTLIACGDSSCRGTVVSGNIKSVNDILQQEMSKEDSQNDVQSETETWQNIDETYLSESEYFVPDRNQEEDRTVTGKTEGIDIDLTSMNADMVYAEVFDMMMEPEEYVGKIIKMEGLFTTFRDETDGNVYFGCIIQDALGCCAQGMEFFVTDEYHYPDDFPKEGNSVCVVGRFDRYQEGEAEYYALVDSKLVEAKD
ncbi:hypothetical protein [Oribacterium sp. WCC10]|uniref:hypothetical protein n=1 Tax=Oribacterium sp. WCC10 TaxID=1855343 RepID=UPI0008EDFA43|nr:hypothetical protein [Oribacterium sp. WCC10]SFG67113.1 hypothetical protein SAMN05216356_11826 [Oribacterium sp. WCC10]